MELAAALWCPSIVSMGKPAITATRKQSGAILSWLRQRENEMAALLAELVSVPTENPPGKNYRACVGLLERHLRQMGFKGERLASGGSNDTGLDPGECI